MPPEEVLQIRSKDIREESTIESTEVVEDPLDQPAATADGSHQTEAISIVAPTSSDDKAAVMLCLACNSRFDEGVRICPHDSTTLVRLDPTKNKSRAPTPETQDITPALNDLQFSISLAAGSLFDERYQIVGKAGEGGMGTVYEARDSLTNGAVAIKLLNTQLLGDADDQARFKREGKILAELSHPNIVRFHGYGIFLNRIPYLVLEWLDARSLRPFIDEGRMHADLVIRIALQVCEALKVVHEAGIVHRDLKPNNILIVGENLEVKLVDFGLSRVLANSPLLLTRHLTRTGLLIGSVHYMSPEQCMGKKVDGRADIYALGCIMYEMLTGLQPFTADSPMGLLSKHVNETEKTLAKIISSPLPAGLAETISRAMAKEPDERYQNVDELKADILLVQNGNGKSIRPLPRNSSKATNRVGSARTAAEQAALRKSNEEYAKALTLTAFQCTLAILGIMVMTMAVLGALWGALWLLTPQQRKNPNPNPNNARTTEYARDVKALREAEERGGKQYDKVKAEFAKNWCH